MTPLLVFNSVVVAALPNRVLLRGGRLVSPPSPLLDRSACTLIGLGNQNHVDPPINAFKQSSSWCCVSTASLMVGLGVELT